MPPAGNRKRRKATAAVNPEPADIDEDEDAEDDTEDEDEDTPAPKATKPRAARNSGPLPGRTVIIVTPEHPVVQDIYTRHADGESLQDIADDLGITDTGKAWLANEVAKVALDASLRISTKGSDDAFAARVVKARDTDLLSWGSISARTGVSEPKLRSIYAEATGESHLSISTGKGSVAMRRKQNGTEEETDDTPAPTPKKTSSSSKGRRTRALQPVPDAEEDDDE